MQQIRERANLSDSIATRVRERILDGTLAAGQRINEVHLAADLGVSRTPLREALARLAGEGAVTALPRIGLFVAPLTAAEVEQLYPMRALLDPAALRLAGIPSAARIRRLKSINAKLAGARDPGAVVRLDDQWHRELIAGCPNFILLDLIEQFMWRTRRYELALMRDRGNVEVATDEHERILAALEADDLEGACARLERNMRSGTRPILDWLEERNERL